MSSHEGWLMGWTTWDNFPKGQVGQRGFVQQTCWELGKFLIETCASNTSSSYKKQNEKEVKKERKRKEKEKEEERTNERARELDKKGSLKSREIEKEKG